ncbi:hypothetical protein [Gynuella sp.]|uniref:hypothetical protein n=1 Tax=Gynuella sp. TaxID=2969146 RepID=UPI003D0A3292
MIIFAVTKNGFLELETVIKSGLYPVWVGANVLSEEELSNYREMDIDITNFSYEIDPSNDEELDDALITVAEHHPGERVWLECKP